MSPAILLSFDVEEFDMPVEYNHVISMAEQMEAGKNGLYNIMPILEKYKINTTLFTTANFALKFPDLVASLSNYHEIASHTYFHSKFEYSHLIESKEILESITKKDIIGLRMPRMKRIDLIEITKAGYKYDSSLHPTLIPGRYNNLHLPRTIFKKETLTIVPASVSPILRLPLFWLAFKNYPYSFFKNLAINTLKKDGYVCLYFHPWEFIDLSNYKIPQYTKKIDGKQLVERLDNLINDLSPFGEFMTIKEYLSAKELI